MNTPAQRGLSLVELMVGLAIGLLIVAAASVLLAHQVHEQRSLAVEQRLMQNLRSAIDVITRDLRRAGHRGVAASQPNPYAAIGFGEAVTFSYSRDAVENHRLDSNEQFGLRLHNGSVELQLGADNWQALTDPGVLTVTRLQITPTVETLSLSELCAGTCPATEPDCGPRMQVRSVSLLLQARAVADVRVQRNLRSTVRVRNDALTGICPEV